MSRGYQRGMRPLGKQPGRNNNDRWDKNINILEQPPKRKPVLIRPVGGILTVGVHWIVWKSPNDNQFKKFQALCPNWNLAEQVDQDRNCPVCKHFHRWLQIENKADEYLKMPQKFRYLFHAYHVSNIKKNSEPEFGVVNTHILGIDKIEEAMLLKGVQPDDPDNGFCLNWLIKDGAKGSGFGSEVSFSAADDMKVKWNAKKGCWMIKVGKRVVEGYEQQLLDEIPEPMSAQELENKLSDFGLFTELDRVVGSSSRKAMSGPPADSGSDDDDWNENEASEDAGDEWPSDADDAEETGDEEWGEEGEGGEEESGSDEEWGEEGEEGDGDDWGEEGEEGSESGDEEWGEEESGEDGDGDDWGDEEEAEPEPEPKPKAKKAAKKKAAKKKASKKKATKKKAAKKAPPPEPESEDGDDWGDEEWD